mgnify:FL=1|jgi:hypothetical protein
MKRIASLLLVLSLAAAPGAARKISLKLKAGNKKTDTEQTMKPDTGVAKPDTEQTMKRGSFMVASQCEDCNNGYTISQIAFSGFDKPGASSMESFFITNHTDRTMSGVSLYIEYLTPDGRQLHKRYVKLDCNIPAGETRKCDIKSWDTQRSFHYELSRASRRSSPFSVRFDPVAFYLRF